MKDRNKCHRILMGVLIITRAFTISYNKKTHQNDVKKTYLLLLIRSFKGEKGAIFCLLSHLLVLIMIVICIEPIRILKKSLNTEKNYKANFKGTSVFLKERLGGFSKNGHSIFYKELEHISCLFLGYDVTYIYSIFLLR